MDTKFPQWGLSSLVQWTQIPGPALMILECTSSPCWRRHCCSLCRAAPAESWEKHFAPLMLCPQIKRTGLRVLQASDLHPFRTLFIPGVQTMTICYLHWEDARPAMTNAASIPVSHCPSARQLVNLGWLQGKASMPRRLEVPAISSPGPKLRKVASGS